MKRVCGSDVRRFVNEAEASGCRLEGHNANGHLRLRHGASNRIFVAPSKIEGTRRHAGNLRAQFRRFLNDATRQGSLGHG